MNLNSRNKVPPGSGSDEVEEMLREAEDAMLLKLSTNSHVTHLSSILPSDLERRYQGLKSGSNKLCTSTPKLKVNDPSSPVNTTTANLTGHRLPPVVSGNSEDDLLARFSALKASLPKPSSSVDCSSSSVNPAMPDDALPGQISKISGHGYSSVAEGSSCDGNEDEVEKLIKWAIDAARLDPSPPSDDDDDDDDEIDYKNSEDDFSESSDNDDEHDNKLKKGKRRTGSK